METYSIRKNKKEKIAVVGLGYVGMPLAVAFAEQYDVIGFDIDERKIAAYKHGIDVTMEVGNQAVAKSKVIFTSDEKRLNEAAFIIVAVPTPINGDKTPDLSPVCGASEVVGRNMKKGAIVVYESTVYPGVTEKVCAPILEAESGLKCGVDFKIGYSPERINPGDKAHPLKAIKKIVSGMDAESLAEIKRVYDSIIEAGTYPVSSIKTAEAVKVVENSQRDINIAFMNEMAMVFERMGIDTNEVVDGMNTKWNALGFRPGLVGGHCISVDPYYFIYEAERLGYHSELVGSGRRINDSMGIFVADMAIKKMVRAKINPSAAKVVILGLTFKENCPDIRNTKVLDIISHLKEYDIPPLVVDPWADKSLVEQKYGITLAEMDEIADADCIIHAVAHDIFEEQGLEGICRLFRQEKDAKKVLIDVKGEWPIAELEGSGVFWWRL